MLVKYLNVDFFEFIKKNLPIAKKFVILLQRLKEINSMESKVEKNIDDIKNIMRRFSSDIQIGLLNDQIAIVMQTSIPKLLIKSDGKLLRLYDKKVEAIVNKLVEARESYVSTFYPELFVKEKI